MHTAVDVITYIAKSILTIKIKKRMQRTKSPYINKHGVSLKVVSLQVEVFRNMIPALNELIYI